MPEAGRAVTESMRIQVIIPAAGRATRFGQGRNKLLEMLGVKAVIAWTVEAFRKRREVAEIIIATHDAEALRMHVGGERVRFCPGGAQRALSVREALSCGDDRIEWVAVHDAARPLVSQELIDRTFAAARQYGAAAPAIPVGLTIKQAAGPLPAKVSHTVPRHDLWAMQTPQVMRRADLLDAYAKCPLPLEQVTDDMQLLELSGRSVYLVAGEERNLKITTELDLRVAELLLSSAGD